MLMRFAPSVLRLAGGFCRQRSAAAFRQPIRRGFTADGVLPLRPPGTAIRYVIVNREGRDGRRTLAVYCVSVIAVFTGLAFLAVPLYRAFCQRTGLGGAVQRGHNVERISSMSPVENRPLTISFEADKGAAMKWNFKPLQTEIELVPGETALAFYRARNPTNKPIIGISTYNVVPFEAGLYFNKIQCFCFEEQRLNPGEEVDMPVFFYVDPDILDCPSLVNTDSITLSYTFFEAREEDVDKFLEILQRERGSDLEKAREMLANEPSGIAKRQSNQVLRMRQMSLERAMPHGMRPEKSAKKEESDAKA